MCHCTPAWHLATEQDSVSKKKKIIIIIMRARVEYPKYIIVIADN